MAALPAVQWAGLHFHPLQRFILEVWDHSQEVLGLTSTSTKTGKEVSVVVNEDGKRV